MTHLPEAQWSKDNPPGSFVAKGNLFERIEAAVTRAVERVEKETEADKHKGVLTRTERREKARVFREQAVSLEEE